VRPSQSSVRDRQQSSRTDTPATLNAFAAREADTHAPYLPFGVLERMPMNLFQVNLFVQDFDAMLQFYRDTLGFETNDIEPGPPSQPMVNWASLLTGSVTIELFDAATFWDRALVRDSNRGAVQLCFIVDSVERERERLEAAGVRCDPIITEDWGSYATFRDPEGNWLQIYQVIDRRRH
jgi:catechol 2,3-dioxygenase-like lactoylglutathione lyase family enzyme